MSANEPKQGFGANNATRPAAPGMPDVPYKISVKRDARTGRIVDEVLTVASMTAERMQADYMMLREWFANLPPVVSSASQAEKFAFGFECAKCGAEGEDEFYDNTGDKKPNFKCKNCDTKYWVKPKVEGQGALPGVG